MRRLVLCWLPCLLLIGLPAVAAREMRATPREGDIAIDGNLGDAAWTKAEWQTDFVSASAAAEAAGDPQPVPVQTRFKVLYDQDAVYVGIECDEPAIEKLKASYGGHDQDVYVDDCVEVFLDPAGDGRYYHHFAINSRGAWFDDYGADYGLVHVKLWDIPLQTGASVDTAAKVWRVEVRVPLAGLQLKADAGSVWLWNVTRERYTGGTQELSTWTPLKGNFHQPQLYGKLNGMPADYSRFAVTLGEPKVTVSGGAGTTSDVELAVPVTNDSQETRTLQVAAELFLQPATAVQAEAVELAPGVTETIALPALKVARDQTGAPVQVTVTDTVTGVPAKIVVKRPDTEYRPLTVDILQPVYRNCIYATESVSAIVFRARLAPDVAGRAQRVTYSLLTEAGGQALPGAAGEVTLAQLGGDLTLPAQDLPEGRYTLAVRAVDAAGQTVAETATIIRKLPPAPGVEVRVDDKGNVLVNGEPRMFIGWYGDVPTDDPRPEVIALQDLQTPVVTGPKPEEIAAIHQRFAERGIYSIVSIEPGRLYYAFELWRQPGNTVPEEIKKLSAPSEECVGYLRQLTEALRSEPGVLGYYLADEPEINDARSDYLEAVYRLMQELDPYRPVMITNDTLDGIVTHGYKACDILSPDPYSPAWEYVPNFLKRCHEVRRRGQAIMLTPWTASGQTHFNVEYGTAPPYRYEVMRHQHLVALAMGAKGFTGYTSAFFLPEPRLRYGLPRIWSEIRFLEPAAANPQAPPQVQADSEMIAWAGEAGGNAYLIVANLKAGERTATVSHPLLADVNQLFVVSEGREVAVRDGDFTDHFVEGAVHVYTTDPEGRKLPTTAEVLAEIARAEAEATRPGNLLHVSRGVRARASTGHYAPWFEQYYYYAINGIPDDLGWNLSHTDQPSWLELTLPREESVGRVVIYTPNLKDYDLLLQAADGTVQVAEVRGNDLPLVETRFAEPVPTLKLRVLARASTEGPGTARAIVREIEAYADPGEGPTTPLRRQESSTQAPTLVLPAETAGEPVLWREDFRAFEFNEQLYFDDRDTKWVLKPAALQMQPRPEGGAVVRCVSAEGWGGMSRFIPYDPAYRYLQASISDITGEGYKWALLNIGDSSGKPGFRSGIHTNRPSIYTLDTHYVNPAFAEGTMKRAYLTLSTAGSTRKEDGSVTPGPAITFDWLQLVRRPVDGLAVTLADGSPLPEVLKQGHELVFRLFLQEPALDATLEVSGNHTYSPIPINGQSSLQLVRMGAGDGREWGAQVKLGEGTGTFDGTQGYPVFFRAVITGGAIKDTYAVAAVKFE